jgi:hypothetical protein
MLSRAKMPVTTVLVHCGLWIQVWEELDTIRPAKSFGVKKTKKTVFAPCLRFRGIWRYAHASQEQNPRPWVKGIKEVCQSIGMFQSLPEGKGSSPMAFVNAETTSHEREAPIRCNIAQPRGPKALTWYKFVPHKQNEKKLIIEDR